MSTFYKGPTSNFVSTTLNGSINDSVDSITVTDASKLQYPGYIVIDREDGNGTSTPNARELVSYTGITSNTLTGCTRGADSSTARSHSDGALVEATLAAGMWEGLYDIFDEDHEIETGKHGLTTFSTLNAPEGFLINGKIVPSVASNNLTVALKGMDGNDPSASNPVYCRINGVIRSITAALSVTKADGTNWFNSGSTELATQLIDYFVYLGFNTTDGVVVGFARIPYATQYNEFSTATTNERYCAISTISNAAATDSYQNIGRFCAYLSAGSGYTWTVPTFQPYLLIQRPIYETRRLSWLPTFTGFSAVQEGTFYYQIIGRDIYLSSITTVHGTSDANNFLVTLPMICPANYRLIVQGRDDSAYLTTPSLGITTATGVTFYKDMGQTNVWTTSGTKSINFNNLVPLT